MTLGINPFASVTAIVAQLRSPILNSNPPPFSVLPETDKAVTALPAESCPAVWYQAKENAK